MNGTVIDIPGIVTNVTPHYLTHSSDVAYTVELKDERGNTVKVQICFGKITDVSTDIL